jgi:hypothetical protein
VAAIDEALRALTEAELDALVERARRRGRTLTDEAVTAVIDEALRAVRAPRRP